MIPMLTLGVPGDGATAILMGAFMIHGMIPRPHAVRRAGGNILYAIMLGLIVVNVFMYILGSGFTRFLRAYHPYSLRDFGGYCIDLLHCGCVFHQ